MVTALWAGTMRRLGLQRKMFSLAATQVSGTRSANRAKAGKILLDNTPTEETGQQIEGSRVDS
ncbi:MAG: hypothetical protein E6K95_07535 [Thaumarchaeota archaeon]|nr:MAG: hypothetical protein E6K95_07535 [Nitrososphaerota archaeon]